MIVLYKHVASALSTRRFLSRKFVARLALLSTVLLGVTACHAPVLSSGPTLPDLTGIATIRDTSARTEAATVDRARQLAAKAVACSQCGEALNQVATDAQQRLDALGGLWEPWGKSVPEDAELPAPVADAPLTPQAFASWLAATARRDLRTVADPSIDSADAQTFAALAVNRLYSAYQIADAYDFSLDDAAPLFVTLSKSTPVLVSSDRPTWSVKDEDMAARGPGIQDIPTEEMEKSAEYAHAVKMWDCTAQSLPRFEVLSQNLDNAAFYADALLARSTEALAVGVLDQREMRCSLKAESPEDLVRQVISADLALLTSSSPAIRQQGVAYLEEDALLFFRLPGGNFAFAISPEETPQS